MRVVKTEQKFRGYMKEEGISMAQAIEVTQALVATLVPGVEATFSHPMVSTIVTGQVTQVTTNANGVSKVEIKAIGWLPIQPSYEWEPDNHWTLEAIL